MKLTLHAVVGVLVIIAAVATLVQTYRGRRFGRTRRMGQRDIISQ